MDWKTLLCDERLRKSTTSFGSSDLRTEFEKDYHRIIGSAPFRRLQDKTQVFPLDKNDFIRTRLTHSLEVSSFAKSLGQNVSNMIINSGIDKNFTEKEKEDICIILQCSGLIHDIGNPPFGHFGESTIQEWFKKNLSKLTFKGKSIEEIFDEYDKTGQMKNDFYNFEGNTQALRVVTKLHYVRDEYGMNLTKALLNTIIKYPVASNQIDKKSGDIKTKKMGYFYADKDNYINITGSTGTNGNRHPLTFLLEAADDIAYKTADIEDSVKKGCITYNQLVEELKKPSRYQDTDSDYRKLINNLEYLHDTAVKNNAINPDLYAVQNWVVSYLQSSILYAASDCFVNNYELIMNGEYKYDLFHGTDAEIIMNELGKIEYKYAFTSKPIYKLEIAADTIFNFLLDRFVESVINYDTDEQQSVLGGRVVQLISEEYRKIYEIFSKDKSEEEKIYLRLMMATDYLCGMTDSYAKNLYQELNGII